MSSLAYWRAIPATAQDGMPGNAQGDVAVTIYNNGQSLVQDERQLSVRRPGVTASNFPTCRRASGPKR